MGRRVKFPLVTDDRGKLVWIQALPFAIRRVYYIFDVAPDGKRGGHAHKTLERVFIALAGEFTLIVDGRPYLLRNPSEGLYVAPGAWTDLENFSPGCVCLVLASAEYDENDYIRERR